MRKAILVLFLFYGLIFSILSFVIYETVEDTVETLSRWMASFAVGLSLTGFAMIMTARKLWEILSYYSEKSPDPEEICKLVEEPPIEIRELAVENTLEIF
jgi:formate hydrogenlyase subunit 3/multisubunit Na+/H+ antiporter MnhD subunit